jgi:three-Cys-motif partner protein
MAKGAGDSYWGEQALPSAFKHALLDKYVPQFAGMTGSRSVGKRVVFLDGYAGRGRYDDGSPASAERILRIAHNQSAAARLAWNCYFVEEDDESAAALAQVVSEYAAGGLAATAHHGSVLEVLDEVVNAAVGCPLFLFLDPCGLGIPYDRLVALLRDDRSHLWPPTELLLNFSLDGVRRIGGHVSSVRGSATTMRRLDDVLGGQWWRQHFIGGVTDEAVDAIVDGFTTRVAGDVAMNIVSVPVRRAPLHRPIYHLVFGTRRQHGLWAFGDSVARATQAWWDTLEEVEAEKEPNALFSVTATVRPTLETVEATAVPRIAANLGLVLEKKTSFAVVDHTLEVFGEDYGQVRDRVVREAIKLLKNQKGTSSEGKGSPVRNLIVARP